jgi:EAL domain-containing protein (putative c-di-GMP-specific phosphodiesterase class I)/FixJ family two-component response regulator
MSQALTHVHTAIVVDDDPLQRKVARAVLALIGITDCLEAGDGTEALQVIASTPRGVDLALCDLDMGGMDGIQLLSRLAREHPGVAVVLLSSQSGALIAAVSTMAAASGLEVLGTLEKPLDRGRLETLVRMFDRSTRKSLTTASVDAMDARSIREGLASGAFSPWYQPRIGLHDGVLRGVEALARWQHPALGQLLPARFIGSAEAAGLMTELTWSMIDQSLAALAGWRAHGLALTVSINLSASFLDNVSVADQVLARAQSHGVPPDRVVFELTESMATRDLPAMIGALARLRMRGFGLAIDDFGTGYASLAQLSAIPFSAMKIDRSFVAGAIEQPHLRAILESSIQLGHRLGLETTAEGIETPAEADLVRSLGCDVGQGFLYSPALDDKALERWAVSRSGR